MYQMEKLSLNKEMRVSVLHGGIAMIWEGKMILHVLQVEYCMYWIEKLSQDEGMRSVLHAWCCNDLGGENDTMCLAGGTVRMKG